jgi:pSer/pThr/pTyr-binding forkhead associated (FHA) protein
MTNRHKDYSRAAQAALIVTHGNTANKHRPLLGDAIILGRGRGCDLRLEAGDVSELHCIITRRPDGFRIRDCASRAGTRLNGEAVQEAMLDDGDVLQIGSFSFRVEVTPGEEAWSPPEHTAAASRLVARFQRSRRHFAMMALALRRRLRLERAGQLTRAEQELAEKQAELELATLSLRTQLSACDHRAGQLQEAERELTQERLALDAEREAVQLAQQQLAEHSADRPSEHEAAQSLDTEAKQLVQEAFRELEIRQKELAHFADHLQRTRRAQQQEAAWLAAAHQTLSRRLHESLDIGKNAAEEANGATGEESMSQVYIDAQRRVMPAPAAADVPEPELDLRSNGTAGPEPDKAGRVCVDCSQSTAVVEDARELIAVLTRQLEEKDALIEELCREQEANEQRAAARAAAEIERFEVEFRELRRQLQADRQVLEAEARHLQVRRAELEETVREEERQICRERIDLARERVDLERLRELHRIDLARAEREGELRKRLEPLRRHKEGDLRLTQGNQVCAGGGASVP